MNSWLALPIVPSRDWAQIINLTFNAANSLKKHPVRYRLLSETQGVESELEEDFNGSHLTDFGI
jgi:hypothetical protein